MLAREASFAVCDVRRMRKRHPDRPFLKSWRNKIGMTQEYLASLIGRDHSVIAKTERGQQGMDDETFAEIARVLGITVAELSAPPEERDKAKAMDRVLSAMRDMDAEALQAVTTFAERIAPKK